MRTVFSLAFLMALTLGLGQWAAATETDKEAAGKASGEAAAKTGDTVTYDPNLSPLELIRKASKGSLKNPYTDDPKAIKEGKGLYFSYSCNGCHGGTGGGGMCPPLSNEIWIYGSDDDTLFRLITHGTKGLEKDGYSRKRKERVVGPMPPFGELVETVDELWKIIAYVRTTYRGDPKRRNW